MQVAVLATNLTSIDNAVAAQESTCLRMGSDLVTMRDQVGQVRVLSEQVTEAKKLTNELSTKCDNLYRVVDNMKEDVEDALKAASRGKPVGELGLTGDQEGRVQGLQNDITTLQRVSCPWPVMSCHVSSFISLRCMSLRISSLPPFFLTILLHPHHEYIMVKLVLVCSFSPL